MFPRPAHSILPNWKRKADDVVQVQMPHQGEGSIEKRCPTSSLFSNIPVSIQLIHLGLVSCHCLKQKAFCEKINAVMRGVANRRHICENPNKSIHSPLSSSCRGSIPLSSAGIRIKTDSWDFREDLFTRCKPGDGTNGTGVVATE